MPDYSFNPITGRYANKTTGADVDPAKINGWIDDAGRKAADNMAALTRRLRAGTINSAEWAIGMGDEIKNVHRAAAMIAAGGRGQMTLSDWGAVGARVRQELTFLNNFAGQIEDWLLTDAIPDSAIIRAASYAQASYVTYELAVRRRVLRSGEADHEENILEGGAEHCDGCKEMTELGLVVIGTLVPPGGRNCGARCRCRLAYSRE